MTPDTRAALVEDWLRDIDEGDGIVSRALASIEEGEFTDGEFLLRIDLYTLQRAMRAARRALIATEGGEGGR